MDEALAPGHRRAARPADVPALRRRAPTSKQIAKGIERLARARPSARPSSTPTRAVELAARGRGRHPGPPRDQPRRPARHDRRPGHPDQPRRQDLARRRRRPRHGQDLRLRRRGARGRHQASSRFTAPGGVVGQRGRRHLHRRHHRRGLPRRGAGRAVARWSSTSRATLDAATPTTLVAAVAPAHDATPTSARRLRVRANADTAEDAARARRFGAQGIGLCRTEHMFLGERRAAGRAS